MPIVNGAATKLISLEGLATYNGFKEDKAITMTSAQYAALTPEEKNNGKTYYVTDAVGVSCDLAQYIFTLRQTLSAGSTEMTFSDARLSNNSLIEIFFPDTETDLNYNSFEQLSATSFKLTFDAQESDVSVVALVFNV